MPQDTLPGEMAPPPRRSLDQAMASPSVTPESSSSTSAPVSAPDTSTTPPAGDTKPFSIEEWGVETPVVKQPEKVVAEKPATPDGEDQAPQGRSSAVSPSPSAVEPVVPVQPAVAAEIPPAVVLPPTASTTGVEFTTHETQLMSKMSNDAREYFKARLVDLKAARAEAAATKAQVDEYHKNVLPASYHQNPDAYMLSPEYKSASTDLQYVNYEQAHWTEQAQRIRAGEKTIYDLSFDQQGRPVKKEVAVTPENAPQLEVSLQNCMQNALYAKQQALGRVQQIQATYTQRYEGAVQKLEALHQGYFKSYMDPKSPRAAEINNFKQYLPPEFREHPLAQSMAYSYGMILDLVAKLKQVESGAATQATIRADQQKAGPVVAPVSAAPSAAAGAQVLSIKDFGD